jgi:lipopolysaccharide/colanic/teichoic acid biosynthesis glycosyltransferase
MTGLWQVSGRSNVTYSRRVSLDVLYVRRQNLRLDCWVVWRTIFVVIQKVGAH